MEREKNRGGTQLEETGEDGKIAGQNGSRRIKNGTKIDG